MTDTNDLRASMDVGEQPDGAVEYKERLTEQTHLEEPDKRNSLVAQLRHRVLSGNGEAVYVVGVTDDGNLSGLDPGPFTETIEVVDSIASDAGAEIESVSSWDTDGGIVGLAKITSSVETDEKLLLPGNNNDT